MKKTIYPILALTAILVISCNNPKNGTIENPYAGAWEITYTKYIFPDSTNETTQFTNPSVKLLTKKHFSFGHQSGTNRVAGGGGEYSYDGDSYTETIKYHVYSSLIGKTVNFKSKIEGDLWTINYSINVDSLKVDGTETWKRIVE